MPGPPLRAAVGLAAIALLGGAAPATAKKHHVLHSPGYKGTTKVPKTKAPPPPPPVVLSQNGTDPQVLVDDAGTAHIVWTEEPASGPDVTHYCRLKRGATTCDNPPSTQQLVPDQPDSDPNFNIEYAVRVLAVGDDLAIVSYRFPNVTQKPNGDASSSSTYLWLSSDGGNSFSPAALVGDQDPSGDAVVFGPPDAPRIGLISDTQTGGTFFQSIVPGRYTGATANLDEGDNNRAYGGTLAAVGGGLLAAFADNGGHVYVRQWTGQGDPNDASTWTPSPPPFPDSEPQLASGPSGTYLLTRQGLIGHQLEVRPLNGTQAGSPTSVSDTSDAHAHAFFEDASGKLYAAWVGDANGAQEMDLRTSTDGRTWGADQRLATGAKDLRYPDVNATADGGGFVAYVDASAARRRSAGSGATPGKVLVNAIGSQAATGKPGLGNLEGGSGAAGVTTSCQQIAFGAINAHATEGCLLSAIGRAGTKVSEGTIDLNGIQIVPDAGTKIVIDGRGHTIDSSGTVTVQLAGPGIPPIVLFRGELHLRLDGLPGSDDSRCPGQKLISFSAGSGLGLEGFPIDGSIDIYLTPQGACIPMSLALPAAFGGIRGDAVLRSASGQGLHLDSLHIGAAEIPIGPLSIEDLAIDYTAATDEWVGGATLALPPQPGGAKLGATVHFKGGNFEGATVKADLPYPGIALDPFAVSYLYQLNGGFDIAPPTVTAGLTFGVLPLPPSFYTMSVHGQLTVVFKDPVVFHFDGDGTLLEIPVGDEHMTVTTDGFARAIANIGLNLAGVLEITGGLDAFADLPTREFGASINGKVCVAGVCGAQEEVVVSSKGMGACFTVAGLKVGFGYAWGNPLTSFDLTRFDPMGPFSCDVSAYKVLPPPGAGRGAEGHAAQAAASTFTVGPGTTMTALRLDGASGAPAVALVDPSGARIVPATSLATPGAPAYAIAVPAAKRTFVSIAKPVAGTWRVETLPGSSALTAVAQASGVPEPQVSGRVSGHGRKRVLHYAASTGNGLATSFFEQGKSGRHFLGVARHGQGTIRFHPGPGKGGKRAIVAVVERNGLPRLSRTIASYVAPAPARPARVRHVRVSRTKRAITVHWKKVAGAAGYLVRIDVSDGRHEARTVSAKKSRVRLPAVPRRRHVKVRVQALDATGHHGPSGAARG